MKLEESQKRQKQLEDYLYELAKKLYEEPALYEMADKLKELYSEDFRHNYSRFYPLIVDVFREDNQYNSDFLSTNIDAIRILVEKDHIDHAEDKQYRFEGLYSPLTKLSDHINLEIARYAHTFAREGKLSDLESRNEELKAQLKDTKSALDSVTIDLQNAQEDLESRNEELKTQLEGTKSALDSVTISLQNAQEDFKSRNEKLKTQLEETKETLRVVGEDLQNAQKEYVAILGIFAAVVLAFTGGIAYSTSVFENIQKASIYRIALIVVLIGFTLFNLLYFLFTFIRRLVERKDSRHSQYSYKTFKITNGIIVIILVLILAAWRFGWVEKRNERIQNHLTSSVPTYTEIIDESNPPIEQKIVEGN